MKILVYGAGVLGSLYAARLQAAGHEVWLLARGKRLEDLRQHGIVLVDVLTGGETVTRVNLTEKLEVENAYDLVLVIMRKNQVGAILPALAANQHTPNVLFMTNNAAGPAEYIEALGEERVLLGFPMAAGYFEGHVIHILAGGRDGKEAHTPIGEAAEAPEQAPITPRLVWVGEILSSMEGFSVDLRTDMDAWLKYHVALLMPSLVPALNAADMDILRLSRTRDLVVLGIRAIKEGFSVLRSLGVAMAPKSLRQFAILPEPLLVYGFQKRLQHPMMQTALVPHAKAAPEELKHLADEFMELVRQSGVPTPSIDRLYAYFDPETPHMPEGRAEIPLDYRQVWMGGGVLAGVAAVIFSMREIARRVKKTR